MKTRVYNGVRYLLQRATLLVRREYKRIFRLAVSYLLYLSNDNSERIKETESLLGT